MVSGPITFGHDLTQENYDYILWMLAQQDCCPICLGIGAFVVYGPPLNQIGQFVSASYLICPKNKYHLLSAVVTSCPAYVLVSLMDKLDRPL